MARRYNLAGKNLRENIEADMYVDQITDVFEEMILARFEKDENRRKECLNRFVTHSLPKNMKYFEDRLKSNKGHLASDQLTYADLYLYTILEWWFWNNESKNEFYASNPYFKALDQEITSNPKISKYRESRPVTDF